MYKIIRTFFFLLLLGCSIQLTAQPYPAWSMLHDFCIDTPYASNNVAQFAEDSFFIVAGQTYTPGVSGNHGYIARIDYTGKVQDSQNLYFPGPYNVVPAVPPHAGTNYPLVKFDNNKYLLAGNELDYTINSKRSVYQPYFYFFNSHCDSLHFRKYTDTIISRIPYSVMVDGQKNIVVTGLMSSQNIHLSGNSYYWDSTYIWLAKYDSNANQIWSRKYFPLNNFGVIPVTGLVYSYKTILCSDEHSYLTTGIIWNQQKVTVDVFLMKTDPNGNIYWLKFLPRKNLAWPDMDIISLKDGGYGFVSTYNDTSDWPNVPTDIFYGKLDEDGDTVWTRTFSRYPYTQGRQQGRQIAEAENGDLIITGTSTWYGVYNILLRTNAAGQIKWYRTYRYIDSPPGNYDFVQEVAAMSYTPRKQILLSGKFNSNQKRPAFDTIGTFSWFVLTDTFGCVEPGCQAADTMWAHYYDDVVVVRNNDMRVRIYPNPTSTILHVEGAEAGSTIELIDILGRKCAMAQLLNSSIDVSGLVSGVYVVRVNGVVAGRVVKE